VSQRRIRRVHGQRRDSVTVARSRCGRPRTVVGLPVCKTRRVSCQCRGAGGARAASTVTARWRWAQPGTARGLVTDSDGGRLGLRFGLPVRVRVGALSDRALQPQGPSTQAGCFTPASAAAVYINRHSVIRLELSLDPN